MSSVVAYLSSQAMALAPQDRARLAEELLASLDPHEAQVEAAWDEVLRQRIAEIEQGSVESVSADQAFAHIRARLRQ